MMKQIYKIVLDDISLKTADVPEILIEKLFRT